MDWSKKPNTKGPGSIEDLLQELLNNPKGTTIAILVILTLFALTTMIYKVEPQEDAVITRFGQYVRTSPPGLHFKLPFGIEVAHKVRTRAVHQESFGFFGEGAGFARGGRFSPASMNEESLMFTGDLNIATVRWVVLYRINDPRSFLFNVREPAKNIRDVSQAVMRRVIGDRTFLNVRTLGGAAIQEEARQLTQEILDNYKLGVTIERVELQEADPPEPVRQAFDDVNVAKQEQEQVINRAIAAQNRVIPEARGKAAEQISVAQGYALALVNRAQGDATRFKSILEQYRTAPASTRRRLYLETMEEVLGRMDSLTIVDPDVRGVLPVFGETAGTVTKRAPGAETTRERVER